MNTLNLNYNGNRGLEVIDFPSGCETHVRLSPTFDESEPTVICCRINEHKHLMQLLLLTDAIRNHSKKSIALKVSCLPYARQDRVATQGDSFSLQVLANIINSQGYHSVSIVDPHSEVSLSLIRNATEDYQSKILFLQSAIPSDVRADSLLISPDKGAASKAIKDAYYLGMSKQISFCTKERDPVTGQLSSPKCDRDSYEGKDLYILDDICDGGGTFIMLAKELRKRNCGKINLVVTHGIFSKGVILEEIDNIYCTNSFRDIEETEIFKQFPIWKIGI